MNINQINQALIKLRYSLDKVRHYIKHENDPVKTIREQLAKDPYARRAITEVIRGMKGQRRHR
jgi:hypothetical protein